MSDYASLIRPTTSLYLWSARGQCFAQHRLHQPPPRFITCCKARLQPVTQRHQFIDFCDDVVLFGKGWEGDRELLNQADIECRLSECSRRVREVRLTLFVAK